ncbi:MAG: CARDB domain-containing protein [Thermodesulfovibrionales bacterium]
MVTFNMGHYVEAGLKRRNEFGENLCVSFSSTINKWGLMMRTVRDLSRSITIIFLLPFFLLLASEAYPQSSQIDNGLVYLGNAQSQTGSWGNTPDSISTEYFSTVEVLLTLNQLGLTITPVYQNGIPWILSQEVKDTAYLAKKIQIMANSGVDLTTDITMLTSYKNIDSGWGGYLSFESSNYRTALAIQALKAANYSDQTVIQSGIDYLLSTQNTDGGWGVYPSPCSGCEVDESNVYMTALFSSTLQQFPRTTSIATAINKAISYLIAHQNTDGGFGSSIGSESSSTVFETAYAYLALVGVSTDATVLGNAINYLTSTQLPDGSWDEDPYSTALALRAMSLNISPPPQPTSGSATAVISDASTNQPLSGVSVILQSNASINTLSDSTGSFTLTDIPAGSQKIMLSLTGYAVSTLTVNIVGGSTLNLGTISISANPTTGTIKGAVKDASSGQPLSGATITVTGSYNGSTLSESDGTFSFTNVPPGTVTLTVSMSGYYPVGGTGSVSAGSTLFFNPNLRTSPPPPTAINLSITSGDITFSNPAPKVGDTVTITAIIHNAGFTSANNVFIQFFDGNPSSGGLAIVDATIPSIAANGALSLSLDWTVTAPGAHKIFVLIDPLNAIEEQTKSDNTASANLTVASLPDLSITSPDIIFTPAAPMPGDPVTITATIRNLGEAAASNVPIDIYDGDPAAVGARIYNTTVPLIGGGSSFTLNITANLVAGNHNIYVIVDRSNSIIETSKTNNTAMKSLQFGGNIDLVINNSDITFTPMYPTEGNMVTINAILHNQGDAAATNVLMRFYLGDPDTGGTQIGPDTTISTIQARSSSVVTTTWDTTGHVGNNNIYVKVDPLNSVPELSEVNNEVYQTIKVAARTGPDLAMTVADLNIVPLNPNEGDILTLTANVRNTGSADANDVFVEFSLGDPNVGGTLILGSQTIPFIAKGSSATAQISWNTGGFAGTYEIYANADPFNEIPELNEQNNMTHMPLLITGPQGVDLTSTSIDTTNLITDTQTLKVTGSINVIIQNKGNQPTNVPFEITAFEDKNGNKALDPDTDNIIGSLTYANSLAGGATDTVVIPVSGTILFRDNIIYVIADSTNSIVELDETNNTRSTGQQCEYIPPVGTFNPVEKWSWTHSSVLPTWLNVMMTPAISDINQDGVPDVIFGSTNYTGGSWVFSGVLRALDGRTGTEIFTVTDPNLYLNPVCSVAVGDIDLDGLPEIVACDNSGYRLIVFDHNGNFKWRSPNLEYMNGGAPSLADLNGDGKPEIVIGRQVLDSTGKLLWTGTGGSGTMLSLAADINLDGKPEVIAGNTAYDSNGNILWRNTVVSDGRDAVGNFDGDPYPEIVVVGGGWVWLLDHTGKIIWGPKSIPGGGNGGAPTIADYDGDGKPEIGVAGAGRYVVFKSDGIVLWQSVTSDYSSNVTGSSVFDFDGDGKAEVVYRDEHKLRVYRGTDGQILFETPMSSCTWYEYVLVADVDGNNKAEIVAVANNNCFYGTQQGIHVFGDANNNWVNTRKIWNQYTYHITNVNDDGTIPRYERNNWDTYNTYRCNSMLLDQALATADVTTSSISADQTNYPSSVILSARIGNGGAASQISAVDVAFFKGDPQAGGVLIGTVQTSKTINPGEFQDVSITWNNPSSGQQTIYVVADKDHKLHECRTNNNTDSATFNFLVIQPPPTPQKLPDLEITASDIAIVSANSTEGQPAVISAIIHNIGELGAQNVNISFYDGDPQSGGTLISSVTKSFIDSGATALAEMPWNTFGQSGRNYIHVIVDPQNLIQESNENNNSTLIPIDVSPPSKPDLAITSSDITFSSLNPKEGDPLTLNASIHNFGTDTSDIEVYLYDGNPLSGGILFSQKTIQQIITFGGTFALSFSLDTIGQTGNHSFYITVDPNNLIDETNETNNSAWNSIIIGSSNLSLSVSTDKALYTADEDVQIAVSIGNLINSDRSGILVVKIIDLNNNVVSIITNNEALTLSPDENKPLNYTWNTGQTLSGNYRVYSHFVENGNIIARADTPITINPLITIFSKVTTDKISYFPNETVTLTSTIQSASTNYIFENLSAKITIANNQGTVLYTETNVIPILMPGQLTESRTYWNTSTNPPGVYPVTLEVKDSSGTVLSTSSKILTITDAIKPSKLLKGQISVDKQSLLQGEPVAITYSITNVGNIDLQQIDISILTVHVVELTAYDTLTDQTSLQMGATYTNTRTLNTNNYSAKDYLVILRAGVSGVEETLAGTYFRVEGAPSAPSLNLPEHGEDIETLTPLLSVNNASDPNDDKLTYEFELYTDSNLTNLLTSSGMIPEGENITSWLPSTSSGQVPLELQENSIYYWRARAYDGRLYGEWMLPATFRVNLTNEPPTAPTLSSPADNSEVDTLTPILIVNNASDPDSSNLTYNFELALDSNFTQIAASQIGIFEGAGTTSWHPSTGSGQEPLILQENTYYYWRAQADDWLIEGPWMTTARFFVNTANDAPTTPSILYPLNNTEITTLDTDIIVSNSEDPDSTTISYIFEIDTVNTFDSLNIIRSGNIPTTSWHIEGLNDNTYYYIRAKASDGLAESQWSDIVSFFVNTTNDVPTTPVLANPSDGSGVNTFNPILSVHNSSDIDRDVLTYEFEVYGDLSMTTLVTNITGIQETPQITSWTVPINLTENNTYYWRARAYDGELYSGWMPLASFMVNTANDAPSAPSLHLPANGSSLDTLNPTLSVYNAIDPDSDTLTYDFEIYSNGTLIKSISGIPQDISGITSVTLSTPLTDNTTYNWRARAYDGDRYGAWMDMATFSIHLPVTNITATIDFDPNTLNQKSKGNWVTVYIELPRLGGSSTGYNVNDIVISSIRLNGIIPAETWPYSIGDYDKDGIKDLMVKFKRNDVINLLPSGDNVQVLVTGTVGTTTFEGVDVIRVIH